MPRGIPKKTTVPAPQPIVAAAQVLSRLTHADCVTTGITFEHDEKDHERRYTAILRKASEEDLATIGALAP